MCDRIRNFMSDVYEVLFILLLKSGLFYNLCFVYAHKQKTNSPLATKILCVFQIITLCLFLILLLEFVIVLVYASPTKILLAYSNHVNKQC